ncbi:MAG: type II CAAX endopeptidase family protein [Candidatus Acidiferrales bacterium]
MESVDAPEYHSPIERLAFFIRDFLPAHALQLLFPLGSFLLLLGASHSWYVLRLPGAFEALQQPGFQVDHNALQQFMHSYNAWVVTEEEIAMGLARVACFASLVLWCLSVREVVRSFIVWVFLPAGVGLAVFPTFLIATTRERNASFDAFTTAAHVALPATHPWFPTLGDGIYLTVSGLIVFVAGLILMRRRVISLPLRFRGDAGITEPSEEAPRSARDIFVFVIFMIVWTFAVSWGLSIPVLLGKTIFWNSRSFAVFQWAPALANALAATCLAFFLLRTEKLVTLHRLLRRRPFRDYLLGLAIPLACVLLPRFLLGVLFQPYLVPSEWPQLFIPHPLPSVLVVYVIAFFEEFAIRGYLQTSLETHFSLKRSIFLTGLLWSLLMGFGMAHSLPHGAFAQFPGVSLLVEFTTFIIYSVPLGWLYARTRSIVATALLHGTIVVFHVGLGNEIHLNHPEFYWTEIALWVFIGWFLFRKNPLVSTDKQPIAEPSAS